MEAWQTRLLAWFDREKRELPWRGRKDPYAVWVSEVMLQQTQVATVIPFYLRWMETFPTVHALASASESEVLSHWAGLGYYRRARMLHAGAKVVSGSGFPNSASEWRAVPGVGRYTAGAIASIAQGEAASLVDGNVERVYARFCGDAASGPALNRAAWTWADSVLEADRPGDWNEALMELGATVCTPKNPACERCPIAKDCVALAQGNQLLLPMRPPRREVVHLDQYASVSIRRGHVGLCQVPTGEWWEGMWQFPRNSEPPEVQIGPLTSFTHVVTHHRIRLEAVLVPEISVDVDWFPLEQARELAMPSPDQRILKALVANCGPSPETISLQIESL